MEANQEIRRKGFFKSPQTTATSTQINLTNILLKKLKFPDQVFSKLGPRKKLVEMLYWDSWFTVL